VVASDKRFSAREIDLAAARVKLGLNLGYWGLGAPVTEQLELVLEAERLGFDSVWAAEAYGSDAATPLAWLAGQTSTIGLGSAIFQIPGRSAPMTAMTAATLDHLSGGRFRLGLGTSGPQVSEGWHGVRFGQQLQRTREYVDVVRMALRRERVSYAGETLTLPLPDGPGKALKLTIGTVQERIPIYIAAIGPKNTALTAEIADGWMPILISPEHMDEFRPSLEEGFAAAGRTADGFDIAPAVSVRIDDDLDAARDTMRGYVALYVGGMGSRKKNFYNRLVASYGFEDAAREVQDLFLEGRKEEAMAALPGELIDAVCLCGPADAVRERLTLYREAGVGTLILSPVAWTLEERIGQLRLVAELAAAA
jgi:F420-dependent oxidoreductase-like protein